MGQPGRVIRRLLPLIVAALLLSPASALAADPSETVGGVGSKWFSGDLIQQPGTNCATAILGSAYPEIMVSGVASYGGAPNGSLVHVGDKYWTSILVAVPGNPCGSGVSAIATDVLLPPGTTVDTSRPIRCFGLPIGSSTWGELTGGTWNHLGYSGSYCPASATPSIYMSGGVSVGFRPVASGQMFQVFLPVITPSQILVGTGDNTHAFRWHTNATGVYANPGGSTVWAWTFPQSNGTQAPFVYFAREPSAQPFWKKDAPAGLENRVELWANFYTAGKAGTVSYEIRRTDTDAFLFGSGSLGSGFDGRSPPV